MRAIVSVSDKSGVVELSRSLQSLNIEIYSTGGTKKALEMANVKVHSISEITGFPEILDGRVKTLHPAVHGGILAKRNMPQHLKELALNKIETIDLVVINLYPFIQTVAKDGVYLDEALENIDEIVSTPGLDGVYIGTIDLGISMGLAGLGDLSNPKLRNAVDRILAVTKKHQRVAGIHVNSTESAKDLVRWGFQLITSSNDSDLLQRAAQKNLEDTRMDSA